MPIPLIAAVSAVGWGATLATLCDIVLIYDKAFIAEPRVNIGLVVGDDIGCVAAACKSCGKELIFHWRPDHTAGRQSTGLANRVVPHEQLMDEARAAAKLLKQPREGAQGNREDHESLSAGGRWAQHLDVTLGRLAATLSARSRRDFLAEGQDMSKAIAGLLVAAFVVVLESPEELAATPRELLVRSAPLTVRTPAGNARLRDP